MQIFRRKPMTEKIETELTALRERAEKLRARHAAADAAFLDAKVNLQRHHLEAPDDADDKVRVKLEAQIAACVVTRDGYADALTDLQAKITDAERKLADERGAAARKAASEELASDLDAIEQALPAFLEAGRKFAEAMDRIHHHHETTQIAGFLRNTSSQIEVAHAFAVQELRSQVNAIREGQFVIPAKPAPTAVEVTEPVPEIRRLFAMQVVRWRDAEGVQRVADQYTDADLTPAAAARALRCNAVVKLDDPRRANLLNLHGGRHPNPKNALDLDDEAACRPAHIDPVMASDPVLRQAQFTVIDRSREARKVAVAGPSIL
jgi:hypothetical protein